MSQDYKRIVFLKQIKYKFIEKSLNLKNNNKNEKQFQRISKKYLTFDLNSDKNYYYFSINYF